MKFTPDKEEEVKKSALERLKGLLFKPSIEAHDEMMAMKKLTPEQKRDKAEMRKLLGY